MFKVKIRYPSFVAEATAEEKGSGGERWVKGRWVEAKSVIITGLNFNVFRAIKKDSVNKMNVNL